ncbi:uncharacterized protein [Nicotiana sylvestris]|uniref:uncharacterized protein n=1 Tax=Nicotiana sylvestris TaxID=4096 RepID=UPI00388CAB30
MVTANASTSLTTLTTLAPMEKPEKFSGIDFKCWQQKIFFYLTTLSLQKFAKEDVPMLSDETPETERFLVIEAWKHSDFLCKNYILSGLEDALYNVYSGIETSKELWTALKKKYKTEDAGLKKFVAAKFLDYKMVDSKNFIEGLIINEAFEVTTMIEKLPPLWKDFKNYLKHKRKKMSLEDLIIRLRIEEDNKADEKRGRGNSTIMEANIIEENKKRKKASGPKYNPSKKRFSENCYNCGKVRHKSTECRAPKKDKKKGQANMVEKHDDVDDLWAMLSECNLVGNPKEWWINSGATRHVCAVRESFATYAHVGLDETISMGNAAKAKIEGCGKIFLKMTSVVISKNEMFVGKCYLTEGLFKLNVMVVKNNNKNSDSSYLLESNEL